MNPVGFWLRVGKWFRSTVAAVLLITGGLLVPLGTLGYWADQSLTNPARFQATVGPLIAIPGVQAQISAQLTSILKETWDQHTLALLLPRASPKVVAAREQVIQMAIPAAMRKVAASEPFRILWQTVTGSIQARLLQLVSQPRRVSAQAGQVSVDISPLYVLLRQQVAAAGFPELNAAPGPKDHVKSIIKTPALERIQLVYRIAAPIAQWLIGLAGLLLLGAWAISRRRRAMVLLVGCFLLLDWGALIAARSVGSAHFEKALGTTKFAGNAPDIFRLVTGYLATLTWVLLFLGVVILTVGVWLNVKSQRRGRRRPAGGHRVAPTEPAASSVAIAPGSREDA